MKRRIYLIYCGYGRSKKTAVLPGMARWKKQEIAVSFILPVQTICSLSCTRKCKGLRTVKITARKADQECET
jgi:hypothetical protein